MSMLAADPLVAATYCHGNTKITYSLIDQDKDGNASDVNLTVNEKTHRYMTAYSWFGAIQSPPTNFKFAVLGEHEFDPLLVFDTYLLDAKNNKYVYCE
jgi:hypothetical protein